MEALPTDNPSLADILGIQQDASIGRGGRVVSLMSNMGPTIDDDTLNTYRADFLRIRLRGQIPSEVDPEFLRIQSSAAVSDAMAVAAGFRPAAESLKPFVTLEDIQAQPSADEIEAKLDSPMMRATIRLAFDYVVATRFHLDLGAPSSREVYLVGLEKVRHGIAAWLLTDIIGHNSLQADNMRRVTHLVDDIIATFADTREQQIQELIHVLNETFDLPEDLVDPEEARAALLAFTDQREPSGERTMLETAEAAGFSKEILLELSLMLFAIRSQLIEHADPTEQFLGAVVDALYFMIGLERPSIPVSLEKPESAFKPNRSKKVRNTAAERYLQAHIQYAIAQIFLSEHQGVIPQRVLSASRSGIINRVNKQIRENVTNDNLAHVSSDDLYTCCVMEVTSVIDQIWPRTAAAWASRYG